MGQSGAESSCDMRGITDITREIKVSQIEMMRESERRDARDVSESQE